MPNIERIDGYFNEENFDSCHSAFPTLNTQTNKTKFEILTDSTNKMKLANRIRR